MPFDADDAEMEYLDYLAREKSGFLSSDPPPVIGMDEALYRLVYDELDLFGDD